MPCRSAEHHGQHVAGTEMLRGQLDLAAVRSLGLLELPGVERESRQTLLSRDQLGVERQRPLAACDCRGFIIADTSLDFNAFSAAAAAIQSLEREREAPEIGIFSGKLERENE